VINVTLEAVVNFLLRLLAGVVPRREEPLTAR
jgi:hypothetical protein